MDTMTIPLKSCKHNSYEAQTPTFTMDTTMGSRAIPYGNSTFVIVMDSQYVLTSSNGTTWNDSNRSSSTTLWGVTYGNNIFVAVGNSGTILSSSNGTSWTSSSSGTSNRLWAVTFKE